MNFNPNRLQAAKTSIHRSLTPTMLIESPKVTLANYRSMIKKSKEKLKVSQSGGLSGTLLSPVLHSDSVTSSDTCIFSSLSQKKIEESEDLRNQLEEMKKFTKNALESQKRYFEEIIEGLELEIEEDKAFFDSEVGIIRDEIAFLREEREELNLALPENPCNLDYKTQYFKNQETIAMLERQNKILYEKIINDISEKSQNIKRQ